MSWKKQIQATTLNSYLPEISVKCLNFEKWGYI